MNKQEIFNTLNDCIQEFEHRFYTDDFFDQAFVEKFSEWENEIFQIINKHFEEK